LIVLADMIEESEEIPGVKL